MRPDVARCGRERDRSGHRGQSLPPGCTHCCRWSVDSGGECDCRFRGGCRIGTRAMSRHNISHRHPGSHHAAHAVTAASVVVPNEPGRLPMHSPVLVLNASYEPINICAARRALVLVLKGVAITEEENGHYLHSARLTMRLPSVIRLLEYRRIPHQTRALSRKNILLRDRNTCQYCGVVLSSAELTLDHVIPRSRGGVSTWENLVEPSTGSPQPPRNPPALGFECRAPRLRGDVLGVPLAEPGLHLVTGPGA